MAKKGDGLKTGNTSSQRGTGIGGHNSQGEKASVCPKSSHVTVKEGMVLQRGHTPGLNNGFRSRVRNVDPPGKAVASQGGGEKKTEESNLVRQQGRPGVRKVNQWDGSHSC